MLLFIVFVIFILWLFQIFLLDSFYREIKLTKIQNLSSKLVMNIEQYDEYDDIPSSIQGDLKDLAIKYESNIYIFIKKENNTYYTISSIVDSTGDTFLPSSNIIQQIWQRAKSSNLNEFMIDASEISTDAIVDPNLPTFHRNSEIIYGQFAKLKDNQEVLIVLNTQLLPVEVATETLEIQLLWIVIILLLFGICLAFMMARFISEPLAKLNVAAKQLPNGKYDANFDATGYLEVDELSSTLNYATKQLKKSESLQRDLVANVSHELRTPLTLISGYSEMIRDIPSENTKENLDIIIAEANRLSDLVNDVLELSKLQSKVLESKFEVFNITNTIDEVLNRFSKFTENHDYVLIHEGTIDDIEVYADESQITQVIYNFVANAINYSKDTSETRSIRIVQTRIDNKLKISVIDEGIGIKKENLENIWNRYYKVYEKQKSKTIGSGLGLAIVKEILEAHNFAYGVNSEYGKGSEFWFILPIKQKNKE